MTTSMPSRRWIRSARPSASSTTSFRRRRRSRRRQPPPRPLRCSRRSGRSTKCSGSSKPRPRPTWSDTWRWRPNARVSTTAGSKNSSPYESRRHRRRHHLEDQRDRDRLRSGGSPLAGPRTPVSRKVPCSASRRCAARTVTPLGACPSAPHPRPALRPHDRLPIHPVQDRDRPCLDEGADTDVCFTRSLSLGGPSSRRRTPVAG